MSKVGHLFLAELGKKRLRPGGIDATRFLLSKVSFTPETQILEVACNMGTNLVEIASRYPGQYIGVDIDRAALAKAAENLQQHHLTAKVQLRYGNALKLPLPDASVDVLINEAMLTMLDQKAKERALQEYYRVLKPGGILLTHDIRLDEDDSQLVEGLSRAIKMRVAPLIEKDWRALFSRNGFSKLAVATGPMSLMSPVGMVRDEGFTDTLKIIKNALKKGNRQQFNSMFRFFRQERKQLFYIAIAAYKV